MKNLENYDDTLHRLRMSSSANCKGHFRVREFRNEADADEYLSILGKEYKEDNNIDADARIYLHNAELRSSYFLDENGKEKYMLALFYSTNSDLCHLSNF